MIPTFKVQPYEDFLGDIPTDVLRLIPLEDWRPIHEQIVANAKGKVLVGWNTTSGFPVPILNRAEFSTHFIW